MMEIAAGKIMVTVFGMGKILFLWSSCLGRNSELWPPYWNTKKSWMLVFIKFIAVGGNQWILTIMLKHYKVFSACIHRVHCWRKMSRALLSRDNARSYTSVCITEAITSFRWIMLLHPLYSPDLTSPVWSVGGEKACKDTIIGAWQNTVHRWLHRREATCTGWKYVL